MKVLVTGIAGSLARLCADKLIEQGHEVIGVDYRNAEGIRKDVRFYRANYNKTKIEDIFRKHTPQLVLHLGRVGNLKESANKRFDLNVIGSAKVMELCVKYDVPRLVVLSTFHIYGAHPHNHIPIHEEEPLRAGQRFPQLADAVQLDNQASQWVFRHPKTTTIVLRPTNIVGPHIKNAISSYLRRSRLYMLLGFDPMWQFVHELDMVNAIMLATQKGAAGIYNVVGAGEMPISEALHLTGKPVLPLPGIFAPPIWSLTYLVDFFRYACVISDEKFRATFGYKAEVGLADTVRSNGDWT